MSLRLFPTLTALLTLRQNLTKVPRLALKSLWGSSGHWIYNPSVSVSRVAGVIDVTCLHISDCVLPPLTLSPTSVSFLSNWHIHHLSSCHRVALGPRGLGCCEGLLMAPDPSQGIRMDAVPTAEMFTASSSLLCVPHLEPGSDCMTESHLGTSGHWTGW
jgi:hypothetical protein